MNAVTLRKWALSVQSAYESEDEPHDRSYRAGRKMGFVGTYNARESEDERHDRKKMAYSEQNFHKSFVGLC